jgi:hypothetical protein
MKIQFDDKSYIEVRRSDNPGKVIVTISARDHNDSMKKITNAVEITTAEFKQLISDVPLQ